MGKWIIIGAAVLVVGGFLLAPRDVGIHAAGEPQQPAGFLATIGTFLGGIGDNIRSLFTSSGPGSASPQQQFDAAVGAAKTQVKNTAAGYAKQAVQPAAQKAADLKAQADAAVGAAGDLSQAAQARAGVVQSGLQAIAGVVYNGLQGVANVSQSDLPPAPAAAAGNDKVCP
jgi:hypothetical protein